MSLVEVVEGKIYMVRPNTCVVRSCWSDVASSISLPWADWRCPRPALLAIMLVLLDGLLEFVNFLLEQHFKQVGHFRLHHVAHCIQQGWHELREHRGKMRVEGLTEPLDYVISKCLIQDVERYRLMAATGVYVLRCLRRHRECPIACPWDGLCRRRDLWGCGRGDHIAPRVTQKLTNHLRHFAVGNTAGVDMLHRRRRCEGGSALGMDPSARHWCLERVSIWTGLDRRYGRKRG